MQKKKLKFIMRRYSRYRTSRVEYQKSIKPSNYTSSYQLYVTLPTYLRFDDIHNKIAIYELQLEWIGHFYALQWLDGSTVVVAVQK